VTTQLGLFEKAEVKVEKPKPPTTVRLGARVAQIPLWKRRREALAALHALLDELEGKRVEKLVGGNDLPSVVVLWGNREASVRIFTDQVVSLRQQEYQGYTLWLLDFWNGFGQHPLDPYRPKGYVSLEIVRFKD